MVRIDADEQKAIELYKSGVPPKQIATTLNRSHSGIYLILQRAGTMPYTPNLSDEDKQKAIKLYKSGVGLRTIATQLKRNRNALHFMLKKAGVTRKTWLSPEEEKQIKELCKTGLSARDIAKRIDRSHSTISKFLARIRLTRPKAPCPVVALYHQGKSRREIIEITGFHRHTVTLRLERAGLEDKRKWRPVTAEQADEIHRLHIEGKSLDQIAAITGRSRHTVSSYAYGSSQKQKAAQLQKAGWSDRSYSGRDLDRAEAMWTRLLRRATR